jgi:adenosylcobyric acid synthase
MKSLMVLGTGSDVGKSIVVAGLCRILHRKGIRVAPFKAQNMALNSFITKEGGEMGRAQVVQAEAAGIEPHVDMNPILLKPTSDMGSQVIIQGRVFRNMKAQEYYAFKTQAIDKVMESFHRLSSAYEVILMEGAGSTAEINLKEQDLANIRMAELADAPVVLVADIDRGGVFAAIVGTLELLTPSERDRVKGLIINRFRGDVTLLEPGIDFIEKRTSKPVLGVIPYFTDISIPQEDSVALDQKTSQTEALDKVNIGVIRLPHVSNYTDFDILEQEHDVSLIYLTDPTKVGGLDAVILPGSKTTISDMAFLDRKGFSAALRDYYGRGGMVIGICGGYQMLGKTIADPLGVESQGAAIDGLGLLDLETTMSREKVTTQASAECHPGSPWMERGELKGYEIHMGETRRGDGAHPLFTIKDRNGKPVHVEDGAISEDGRVWGTYLHGVFDNDGFRSRLIDRLREQKGIGKPDRPESIQFQSWKQEQYDRLADHLLKHLDIEKILYIIEREGGEGQ